MEFTITLTRDEILTICDGINELPYKIAKPIVENIFMKKIIPQIAAQETTVPQTNVAETTSETTEEDNPDEVFYATNTLG